MICLFINTYNNFYKIKYKKNNRINIYNKISQFSLI